VTIKLILSYPKLNPSEDNLSCPTDGHRQNLGATGLALFIKLVTTSLNRCYFGPGLYAG